MTPSAEVATTTTKTVTATAKSAAAKAPRCSAAKSAVRAGVKSRSARGALEVLAWLDIGSRLEASPRGRASQVFGSWGSDAIGLSSARLCASSHSRVDARGLMNPVTDAHTEGARTRR